MTRVKDIISWMDMNFPRETAEDYDNPGLLSGSRNDHVTTVVVALDATPDVVEMCISNNAELLITHHPLIFGGIKSVALDGVEGHTGRILSNLIKNDIALFAAHTNLDKNHAFSNMILAGKIGDDNGNSHAIDGVDCGVVFELSEKIALGDYIDQVRDGLESTGAITIGTLNRKVRKIFVQGGAFDESSILRIYEEGCDAVVSGEIKHHIMLLLEELGISGIIAGHKETENVFMPYLADKLTDAFPDVRFLLSL